MYTIILTIHITMMITSIALMSGALVLGVFGKRQAVSVAAISQGVTTLGTIAGLLMLADSLLSFQCALLTAYLLLVTGLYVFGFGAGSVKNARFVRL